MTALTDFFLKSNRSAVQFELLEISHPKFSQTYYICRNHRDGVTVTLEDGVTKQRFDYYPVSMKNDGARDNLDTGIQIVFGDLGTILPQELDKVENADAFLTYPTCIYRTYSSNDLSRPLVGPFVYEIASISSNQKGATMQAKAPGLNVNRTGELYKVDRFPMLRGFL